MTNVPLFDATRSLPVQEAELLEAAARVIRSGRYILGPEVDAFEREVAQRLGVAHAIGVASGTDALLLALRGVGVEAGDVVLTTPLTFFATVSAIHAIGARPAFADVDPVTLTIDPAAVRRVLDGEDPVMRRLGLDARAIKAIVPVHLFGHPAAMDALRVIAGERGIPLVEDAAQAYGTRLGERAAGALGTAAAFSFFPTKNLGGFGDGGMVTTDDDDVAARVRLLRAHGSAERYVHEALGTNSRLDPMQAALLRVRLRHVDDAVVRRREHAAGYAAGLAGAGITVPAEAPGAHATYHQYAIRIPGGARDRVRAALGEAGIETAIHYPVPAHLQPALAAHGFRLGDYPTSEEASGAALSLPMFPELTDTERETVIAAVRTAVGAAVPATAGDRS